MNIFIIAAVRNASAEWRTQLERHVLSLEEQGHNVHLPHRDTNQAASGIDICRENMSAIRKADEIHLFYQPDSQGTHFDMGMAFAMGKSLRVISSPPLAPWKSFARMATEWESQST